MELQGKIIAALPERSGVSQRGEWKVQEFVLETHDSFPKKMVFDVFGADRLARFNIQVGQEVQVAFDIDAREWNGRWFNSIRAFDVRQVEAPVAPIPSGAGVPVQAAPEPSVAAPNVEVAAPAAPIATSGEENPDDLPF